LNKRKKLKFQQNEQSLLELSATLVEAEEYHRNAETKHCLKSYSKVATQFEELKDYETASYFYKKCLDVSVEAGLVEGEARAYTGLGICEEEVFNIFNSKGNLETAREKATDANNPKLEKEISVHLVRVYQKIAL